MLPAPWRGIKPTSAKLGGICVNGGVSSPIAHRISSPLAARCRQQAGSGSEVSVAYGGRCSSADRLGRASAAREAVPSFSRRYPQIGIQERHAPSTPCSPAAQGHGARQRGSRARAQTGELTRSRDIFRSARPCVGGGQLRLDMAHPPSSAAAADPRGEAVHPPLTEHLPRGELAGEGAEHPNVAHGGRSAPSERNDVVEL